MTLIEGWCGGRYPANGSALLRPALLFLCERYQRLPFEQESPLPQKKLLVIRDRLGPRVKKCACELHGIHFFLFCFGFFFYASNFKLILCG